MKVLLLAAITLSSIISCRNNVKDDNSSATLIARLLNKYPALKKNGVIENKFTLVRHIKDENWQAEFELYEAGRHAGIIILRKNNLSYSIPLFEDEYTEYWLKDTASHKPALNTNFETELKAANRYLKLNRSDFFFTRYLFKQLLELDETNLPDPCSTEMPEYPFRLRYSGDYVIHEMVQSRDSISIQAERVRRIDL